MKKSNVTEITAEHKSESGIVNALVSTLRRFGGGFGFGISPDGKRDYNQIYGYGEQLSFTDFYGMYRRGGIASAVVKKLPKACWGEVPTILSGDVPILGDELKTLSKMGFFSALQRADILNRIGSYSVLLIGVPDGLDLNQPIGSAGNKLDGLYFNPYNFNGIVIKSYDTDPASPRYNLPMIYQLQTGSSGSSTQQMNSFDVHWSRVIHLAEDALDNVIEGQSALEQPFNALTDTEKVRGASAEAFFRNARQQRAIEADKDAKLDPASGAVDKLKDNIDAFDQGWESTIRLQNMSVKNLPVSLADPASTFNIAIETISGQTGIPIRILTGKGGGATTGEEDRASWNQLIADRRVDFCNGVLFRGLQILADAGLLELPEVAEADWSEQSSTTEKDKAQINKTKADTFKQVVEAMSKPVGDEANAESVLKAVGLEDIKIDNAAIVDEIIE